MKITYLSPAGVLDVEQAAFKEIEKRLPQNWVGYAGFQLVVPGSNPLDIDLLLLTDNRILIVELKNWYGDIQSSNGQWIHNGKVHRSPVDVTTDKVRKLAASLKSALSGSQVPHVEPLVVLCNPKVTPSLEDREKQYVMTLAEFCSLADSIKYNVKYPLVPIKGNNRASTSPLNNITKYQLYFSPQSKHIRQIKFSLHGYVQESDRADYVHRRKIFEEYLAIHKESKSSKALMRRWDFNKLAGGNTTATERSNIALREMRLNEHVRIQSEELHRSLLEPIGQATSEEVTTNFTEIYRLSPKLERLDSFLNRRERQINQADRLELVKSILSRYSQLHSLGIAHRDISINSLWIEEPCRVVMSSFATAYFPEHKTISTHRVELDCGDVKLPEDHDPSLNTNPFLRDVFLLGVISYRLLIGQQASLNNGIPKFNEVTLSAELSIYKAWFEIAMSWNPKERFADASIALDRLNDLNPESSSLAINNVDFETFKTQASPATYMMAEQVSLADGKWVYRSSGEFGEILVKIWTSLNFDEKRPSRNRNLLNFLETARSMQLNPSNDYPEIIDFGIGPMGLVLVTRWVDGIPLSEWLIKQSSSVICAQVSLELMSMVSRLHSNGLFHGDIKPDNIVIQLNENSQPRLTLIDIPDLEADGHEGHTPAFTIPGKSDMPAKHRDLFSTAKTVQLLLKNAEAVYPKSIEELSLALSEFENGVPLDIVFNTLDKECSPTPATNESLSFQIQYSGHIPSTPGGHIPSDNMKYHVAIEKNRRDDTGVSFYISGITHRLELHVNVATNTLTRILVREQGHMEYVKRVSNSDFVMTAEVSLHWGATDDATDLINYLLERAIAEGLLTVSSDEIGTQSPKSIQELNNSELGEVRTRDLWRVIAKCEEENATTVSILEGSIQDPTNPNRLLVPFELDSGTIDFSESEQVSVLKKHYDASNAEMRWKAVARLNTELTNGSQLVIEDARHAFSTVEGTEYRLRSRLDEIAIARRQQATERILSGRGLIPSLTDLFDPHSEIEPTQIPIPADLNLEKYELNNEQQEALINTLKFGPLSLLQGPPGTGKTKFISAFIHLVISNGLARNILLVSQSHEAINHALAKTSELAGKHSTPISMVRVGQENMLSENIKQLHDLTIQQRYRENFSSEIKIRIVKAAEAIGLPSQYVEDAITLHLNLGELTEKLQSVDSSIKNSTAEQAEKLTDKKYALLNTFRAIANAKYQFVVSGSDYKDAYEKIQYELALKNGVNSPNSEEKLKRLVKLSLEFRQVLGNPRANFTAFLTRSRQVVAGTCVGIGRHTIGIVDHAYDWVIIDEAARSSPTELAVAMQTGRRVLLVGDHKQLPPTYTPDFQKSVTKKLGLKKFNFSKLNDFARAFQSKYGQQCGRTLVAQYRMAKPIGSLVSNSFYEGQLRTERGECGPEYEHLPSFLSHELSWIDTSDQGNKAYDDKSKNSESRINEAEAVTVLSVLRSIAESSDFIKTLENMTDETGQHIGVICMYAAQRDLIRHRFNQSDWAAPIRSMVKIGTVDSYQGKENRVIILSLVCNNSKGDVGFLGHPERINVALSRAMDRLVIVGATAMWRDRKGTPLHRVVEEFRRMYTIGEASIQPSLNFTIGYK